ncbi:FxLD family lanthipeptide [Nocardiopsis sp. N85]|uniref:FxLD family lanthipeptide n=1 Tax=Nocardiopsis sp. N85 TaxID=3029400 RepID=UPI00237FB001|nr:FxLD family lanthipeptide [Nocardiopsis sp. N85]MDE3721423.1 FxLD family lanthipeptide [Nocardiopsis sp. N85]
MRLTETLNAEPSEPLTLDLRLIESASSTQPFPTSDDGCGSSCPSACTSTAN